MKIALGQINPTVGDFEGNAARIIRYSERARQAGASLIIFPELAICGYPPRDLVEKPSFVARNEETAGKVAEACRGIAVICGLVTPAHVETGKSVMNSAALLRGGRIEFLQSKMLLPTYDVFDESRYFAPAARQELLSFCGWQLAVTVCEDAWNDKHFWHKRLYSVDPVEQLLGRGGNVLVNVSASPFHIGKREVRFKMLQTIATTYKVPVIFVNQVGGNDSLIFDGSSFVVGADGRVVAQAKSFEEDLVCFDSDALSGDIHPQVEGVEASAYAALVLGTRDYVRKCGFARVIIGLSGGIDSALTAVIAVDALGAESVTGVSMPGPYSSPGSIDDARALAANLGIRFEVVPIREIFDAHRKELEPVFAGREEDVTEENLQARIRGSILMALSNKFGALVLSTGNKSELGVGYCTLYGDMVGGLAVISDVPKTMVYRLAEHVNAQRPVIPRSTLEKPPSAELRPNQTDQDTLPPYEVLDTIVEDYVEGYKTPEQIAAEHGYDLNVVRAVVRMVERSEYKRQQAAPGLKITGKAFGVGRRFPIAQKSEV
ncbi:MAG TPA: NAD+ synthase [Terriglobales bacterium]|nr:NAD+ synthase [Terriglobales bacterium]